MSQLFVLRALLFAGECFAASVLLLGIAAVVTRFLKAASLRHLVWLTAFGTMLVLPVAALVVTPQVTIHRPADAQAVIADSAPFSSASGVPILPPAPAFAWNMGAKQIALTLFAFWLIGFGWGALRLLVGAVGINALRMSSRRIGKEQRPGFADVDGCELRIADDHSGPMTWGTLLPVILLPTEAPGWPPERLRAVLLHEVAHVRRRDSLAQTLSRIACALYWPNPLAWVGGRAMRRDAEIAADDAVINSGIRPTAYASELLGLAGEFRNRRFAVEAALSMAGKSALEARMKSVLTPHQTRRGVTSMDVAKIAGVGLLATAVLALVRPSLADDAARAATPSAAAVAAVPAIPPLAVAANELPPPPSADAPPVPPAPPAAPLAAMPPPPDTHYEIDMHGDLGQTMRAMHAEVRHMTPEERRKLHRILHNLHHEIHDAMAKARPEMARAMAELRAHREELKALQPQIEQAMREARPQIERAMEEARKAAANAKMDERARRHIDEAMQRIEMHMDRHRNSNDGGDAMQRVTRDRDMHDMHGEASGDQDDDQP